MSANSPARIKLEPIAVRDAQRRLRLAMELLEQELRRQHPHGAHHPPAKRGSSS